MGLIVNPGSEHKGGSFAIAQERAEWVLKNQIIDRGIRDVELLGTAKKTDIGWSFRFQHKVTGVIVEYETHGLFPLTDHYKDHGYMFCPRDYWKGSSFGNPELEDWLTKGFEVSLQIVRSQA